MHRVLRADAHGRRDCESDCWGDTWTDARARKGMCVRVGFLRSRGGVVAYVSGGGGGRGSRGGLGLRALRVTRQLRRRLSRYVSGECFEQEK